VSPTPRFLKSLCEQYLGPGEGKVSDELIALKKYASTLAMKEPCDPTLLWNPDYTVLAIRGQNLSLARLQSGLNQLIEDTWALLLALTKGVKIGVTLPPSMSEDLRSTGIGVSFVQQARTDPPSLPLLSNASLPLLRPKANSGEDTAFEVDPSAAEEFFHKIKPIVEAIAFLTQTTGSGPLRLSEVVDDRYCNGSSPRNLFISHGLVFLLRRNLKSSGFRGHRSSVIHFPPQKVTELLIYYLVVVRPLEIFLTASLGWTKHHAAYSEFLYVVKGRKLAPQELSGIIARYTDKYLMCRLTGLQLRHVLISIQSVFLPPIVDPSVQRFRDSQAGHSTRTANHVYGQRIDHLPGEDAALFVLAHHWCKKLHNLFGLGPEGTTTRPIPHLHAPSEPTWWSPSNYIPPPLPSPGELYSQVNRLINSAVSFAVQEVMIQQEKVLKESIFQALAAFSATTTPRQLTGTQPGDTSIMPPVSDHVSFDRYFVYPPNTFFLKRPNGTTEITGLTRIPSVATSDDLLFQTLSLYTRHPHAVFNSENQRLLLEEVLKARHENILAILPTGAGKSIAIFGPLLARSSGLSVVVTPYSALRRQLAEQAKAFGISHLVWNQRNTNGSPDPLAVRLVIMITDDLFTEEAKRWVCFPSYW